MIVVPSTDCAALAEAVLAEHGPGDVIDHGWLDVRLGIPPRDARMTKGEAEAIGMRRFRAIDELSRVLRERHGVALESVRGRGYRWVPQARAVSAIATSAAQRAGRELVAGAAKLHELSPHLDPEERRRAEDMAAHLVSNRRLLSTSTRRQLRGWRT